MDFFMPSFNRIMLKILNILNLINADVAIGAMLFSAYFSKLFHVPTDLLSVVVLGLSVWAIYTFDHLVDAKKSNQKNQSQIHKYHNRNYKSLAIVLLIDLVIIAILLPQLPTDTLTYGSILSLVVLIYFLTINLLPIRSIYHKEVLIAVVYFAGVLLIPVTHQNFIFNYQYVPILICYFIVIVNNIITFSVFDSKYDRKSGFPSMTQNIKIKLIHYLFISLNVLLIAMLFLSTEYWDTLSLILCSSMAILLILLYSYKDHYYVRQYYRIVGDGIFYLPVFYLL